VLVLIIILKISYKTKQQSLLTKKALRDARLFNSRLFDFYLPSFGTSQKNTYIAMPVITPAQKPIMIIIKDLVR
jgi:hypothetical protein